LLATLTSNLSYKNINEIVDLALDCHSESVYKDYEPKPEALRAWIAQCKDEDIITYKQGDVVVGLIIPIITNATFMECIVAREYVWYVSKNISNRKEVWLILLDMFEQWAKDHGCNLMAIGSYSPTLTGVYETRGFVKNCDTLFKELTL